MEREQVIRIIDQTLHDLEQRLGDDFTQGCLIVVESTHKEGCTPNAYISSTMTKNETRKCLESAAQAHRELIAENN